MTGSRSAGTERRRRRGRVSRSGPLVTRVPYSRRGGSSSVGRHGRGGHPLGDAEPYARWSSGRFLPGASWFGGLSRRTCTRHVSSLWGPVNRLVDTVISLVRAIWNRVRRMQVFCFSLLSAHATCRTVTRRSDVTSSTGTVSMSPGCAKGSPLQGTRGVSHRCLRGPVSRPVRASKGGSRVWRPRVPDASGRVPGRCRPTRRNGPAERASLRPFRSGLLDEQEIPPKGEPPYGQAL